MDQHNLFYFTYARGSGPGGYNPPLIPACGPGLIADGFANGKAPLTYGSDNTQSFEIGSKNNFNDRAQDRHQRLLHQVEQDPAERVHRGQLRPAVHRQPGHRGREGLRSAGRGAIWAAASPSSLSAGYTDARFTKDSPSDLAVGGRGHLGRSRHQLRARHEPALVHRVRPAIQLQALDHDAFVRADWEYTSRNPWLAPVQDPAQQSIRIRLTRIRCPRPAIPRCAPA